MTNKPKIQVMGSGCPTCKNFHEIVKRAVDELGLDVEVEYITDIQKIVEMGVMSSPVLAVNNKPVMTGYISDIEKLKSILKENI